VRGRNHVEPLRGRDLIRADDRAHLVVEDFRRGSGSEPRPAAFSSVRKSATLTPDVAAPWEISSGENAWMCRSGTAALIARQIER